MFGFPHTKGTPSAPYLIAIAIVSNLDHAGIAAVFEEELIDFFWLLSESFPNILNSHCCM